MQFETDNSLKLDPLKGKYSILWYETFDINEINKAKN